jgi:hypothetical protein
VIDLSLRFFFSCLCSCSVQLCKTQPSNNISFYTLQLQELFPVYLKRADSILESLFLESPILSDSGPSTPISPTSTTGRGRYHSQSHSQSGGIRSYRNPTTKQHQQTDSNSLHGRASFLSTTSTTRRPIFLPSRPSMVSIFSTGSNGTTTGRSFVSYTSTFNGLDRASAKSTASLPQLSRQASDATRGEVDALSSSERRSPRLRGTGMSMVDLPSKAGISSGLSIAEERLRRYQRNAAITAQHAPIVSHNRARTVTGVETTKRDRAEEKGWLSTFNFGTRRFTSRTGSGQRVNRQPQVDRSSDQENSLLISKLEHPVKPAQHEHPDYLDCVLENGPKQTLPHTPAPTPAALRPIPLVVCTGETNSHELDPAQRKTMTPKRALRAFEDESDPPLAPMDPRLLAAEMGSAMTQKVVCSVCHSKGVNFPSCRK